MEVIIERDLPRFLAQVEPFFSKHRMENTSLIAVIYFWLTGEASMQERVGAYVSDGNGAILGVAVNQRGSHVMLSSMPIEAAEALEEALARVDRDVPVVLGSPRVARSFAERRAARLRRRCMPGIRTVIYTVEGVLTLPDVAGSARLMAEEDLPLITRWLKELFTCERRAAARARNLLLHGKGFIWEVDGLPVAFSAHTGTLWGAAHTGPTYSVSKSHRKHYGAAVMRAAHNAAIKHGAEVALQTVNINNLLSTRMVMSAGGEPINEVQRYSFTSQK